MNTEILRDKILQLAVQGKLVPQNSNDEPASMILKRIKEEKEKLIKKGELKKVKALSPITEEEVPYGLPKGWEWSRLGDCCIINPRNSVSDKEQASFVPMKLIDGGFDNKHTYEVKLWEEIKTGFTHFAENDVVVAKITPCFENRKSAIMKNLVNGVGAGTTEINVIRCINKSIIPKYILDICKTEKFIKDGVATYTGTAGQQRVKRDYISNLVVGIPPLNEQLRIVEKADELFTLIKELANNKDELLKTINITRKEILNKAIQGKLVPQSPNDEPVSVLLKRIKEEKEKLINGGKLKKGKPLSSITVEEIPYELPKGWEWVRLGEMCSKIGAGSTPTGGQAVYKSEGIKFIRSQNVYNEGLRLGGIACIEEMTNEKMNGSIVKGKDILLNITGGSIGRCCIVDDDFDIGNVNQHVLIIRLLEDKLRGYIHYCIISNYIQKMIMNVQVGVSREGLSMFKLSRFLIPLPPISEQLRIVQKVDQLMTLCDELQKNIEQSEKDSELLRQSISQEAFKQNGEEDSVTSFGEFIKQKRKNKGITVTDMLKFLQDVKSSEYTKIEEGIVKPEKVVIEKIAEVLKLSEIEVKSLKKLKIKAKIVEYSGSDHQVQIAARRVKKN